MNRKQRRAESNHLRPLPSIAVASPDATFAAAFQHHQAGRLIEAERLYRTVLTANSRHANSLHMFGVLAQQTGRGDLAADCYRRAIDIDPDNPLPQNDLGDVLRDQGRLDEAAVCYRRAIELKPNFPEAYNGLGAVLGRQGHLDEAAACCRGAIELKPDFPEAHVNLGSALQEQGRLAEAVACFRRALELKPDFPEAYNGLGVALGKQGHPDRAVAFFARAIELKPNFPEAHLNLGAAFEGRGHLEEALRHYAKAVAIKPDYFVAFSNLLFLLNYIEGQSPESLCDMARQFGILASRQVGGRAFTSWREAPSGRKLRVGLVSGDLKNHPVSVFLESFLRAVDPARIEFVAFPSHNHEDKTTTRLKPFFKAWEPIHALNDEAAAQLIHASGVQVLLDLSGHTGHNRLPVFAWRPAPVQASWMGYLGTTGVAEMNYIIGDTGLFPPQESNHVTEAVWRLPGFNGCFTPPDVAVDVSCLPALSNNYVTFGCFNDLKKVNDSVVAVWARVLKAVPHSRLMLKAAQLNMHAGCSDIRARFAAYGVAEDRLLLEPASPRPDYLRAYNRIDIALDPFPYPGGTTSFETLWMGVPLLTKKGDRFLSHGGEDIVDTAGLPDWIAYDDDDYVAKAAHFASNLGHLATLRGLLRQQMLASPLCDSHGFARQFEDAMWDMWNRWAGKKQ